MEQAAFFFSHNLAWTESMCFVLLCMIAVLTEGYASSMTAVKAQEGLALLRSVEGSDDSVQ